MTVIETLQRYLPALIIRRLADNAAPVNTPTEERFSAATLFADISGFTQITERLSQQGTAGIEQLSNLLNTYFGKVTDIILAHGGDIVKFAGDAVVALWVARDEPLALVTLRATQCAVALQETLRDYEYMEDVHLRLRAAIGAGSLSAMYVGGEFQRWEFMLAGAPLVQVGLAQKQVKAGQIALSPDAWWLVKEHCQTEPLAEAGMRLLTLTGAIPLQPLRYPSLPAEAEEALWGYIPGAIRARLVAKQSDWLAELRTLTIIFVNLPGLDYTTPLARTQSIMQTLQSKLYLYEGSVNKISIDEKGITLVAALGLPPLAHEDDAARGVRAALEIQQALRVLGVRAAIGVTTGKVFCGVVGSTGRREYTIMGDNVNVAARLMQAALQHPDGTLLCDAATHHAAAVQLDFESLPPIMVKGKADPIAISRPLGERQPDAPLALPLIGREAELAQLEERLTALWAGRGGVVFVEGEAGIGKSHLVTAFLHRAQTLGVPVWGGAGDAVRSGMPYYAWRGIFARLFDVEGDALSQQQKQIRLLSRIERLAPELTRLAPLLNAVLPLDFADNAFTAQLHGEARAHNTRELLARLLRLMTRAGSALLVIEDAHWLDSASWALLRSVQRDVHPLFILIVSRPVTSPSEVYEQLNALPETLHISLQGLPLADVETLISRSLGVQSLPRAVSVFIQEKAEGHPFFSQELAYALRDSGVLRLDAGRGLLTRDADDLQELDFPTTIQGVITSRIDRLPPPAQLVLKIASVIGREFTLDMVRMLHPLPEDQPNLSAHLQTLMRFDLVSPEPTALTPSYTFKHSLVQDVAYNLIPYGQRRQLHWTIAVWHEATYATDLAPHYAALAHHWRRSITWEAPEPERVTNSLRYLEAAGVQALHTGAYRESVRFFSKALETTERYAALYATLTLKEGLSPAHYCGYLESLLSEAYKSLGDLARSIQHGRTALVHLGRPEPRSNIGLMLGLGQQLLLHFLHRVCPWLIIGRRKLSPELLELGQAYYQLQQNYYFTNQMFRAFYVGFCNLNLLESLSRPARYTLRVGTIPRFEYCAPENHAVLPALGRVYASTAIGMSAVGFFKLAQTYARLSWLISEQGETSEIQRNTLQLLGLYYVGLGHWEEAKTILTRALKLSEQFNDRLTAGYTLVALGNTAFYQGLPDQTQYWGLKLCELAENGDNSQQLAWGYNLRAMAALLRGEARQSLTFFDKAQTALSPGWDFTSQSLHWGLRALSLLQAGDSEAATSAAEQAFALIETMQSFAYPLVDAYRGIVWVALGDWERAQAAGAARGECRRLQQRALVLWRRFYRIARVFPFAQPLVWYYRGRWLWLAGSPRAALRTWHKGLIAARERQTHYEQMLLLQALAEHLPATDPLRAAYAEAAAAIRARVGIAVGE